jgi:hypothetical protein
MRKPKASEALRVAQQIAAIRAALHKHGYQIRKRPKQAAWTITHSMGFASEVTPTRSRFPRMPQSVPQVCICKPDTDA